MLVHNQFYNPRVYRGDVVVARGDPIAQTEETGKVAEY